MTDWLPHLDLRDLVFACIGWAITCAFLALREAALDFAERRLAEEAISHAPYGDIPFIGSDDLKSLHHVERK